MTSSKPAARVIAGGLGFFRAALLRPETGPEPGIAFGQMSGFFFEGVSPGIYAGLLRPYGKYDSHHLEVLDSAR